MLAVALFLSAVAYRALSGKREGVGSETARSLVVAARDLEQGHVIDARDVELSLATDDASDALRDVRAALGRALVEPVRAGGVIRASTLSELGVLARNLREGESAVAVEVDGVTGLGGFVRPGEAVDVLFLMRRDGREIARTQARTLLVNVRVLAFGSVLEETTSNEPVLNARTAVLAVPAQDAPTLLLADEVGTLRLALRQSGGGSVAARHPSASLDELLRAEARTPAVVSRAPIPIIRGDRPGERERP